jgi:hypothetical protein
LNTRTKKLIEDYLEMVVSQIHHIADQEFDDLSSQAKLDYFVEVRQTFGASALLLEGGSTFGN